MELFEKLGIDYRKEGEVWEASPKGAMIRFYSGWFHFIGAIEQYRDDEAIHLKSSGLNCGSGIQISDSFGLIFEESQGIMHGLPFINGDLAQVTFFADVPWVLEDDPGGVPERG